MLNLPTLVDRLRAGDTVTVMSMGAFPSPKFVEIAGRRGNIHGIWIDQEHAAVSHAQLELMLIACRAAGLDAFARVAPTDYATVMRPMEAGCSGVMLAQVRSAAEVERAVAWAKYPPQGVRGLFLGNVEANYGRTGAADHVRQANQQRWIAVQIETREAVDQLDQIAAVPGVDLLFVGPGDLACNLGVPGQPLHPDCIAALERVVAASHNSGIPWGTLCRDPKHAQVCRTMGCRLFSVYGDLDVIQRGFDAIDQLFGPSLFS